MKDLSRNVSLLCSICGNNQFETLDKEYEDLTEAPDSTRFKCSDCGRVFTKFELIDENEEIINANIQDIKNEAVAEVEKELKKTLKKMGGKW